MRGLEVDRDELEALVAEYRRVRTAHRGAREGGRVRRHLERSLAQIEQRFERLLTESSASPELRRAWLEHLQNQAPEPVEPSKHALPLGFKGLSENGSVVELRARSDGDYDVFVDGAEVERVAAADDLAQMGPGIALRVGDISFHEVFDASPDAVAALARFVSAPHDGLAPEHVPELLADGLVDRDLGLTHRGRRALRGERPAAREAEPALRISARGDVGAAPRRYLERRLQRVLQRAPLRVLGVRTVITAERNSSLERPVSVKATVEVRGPDVRVHAAAASATEAVDLLAERLARRLRELEQRREAKRREPGEVPGTEGP